MNATEISWEEWETLKPTAHGDHVRCKPIADEPDPGTLVVAWEEAEGIYFKQEFSGYRAEGQALEFARRIKRDE